MPKLSRKKVLILTKLLFASLFSLQFLLIPIKSKNPVEAQGQPTRLILHQMGGNPIFPSDIKNNLSWIEANREFIDGVVLNGASSGAMSGTSTLDYNSVFNTFKGINSSTLKYNFALMNNSNPGGIDDEAAWSKVAQNWATYARAIKDAGLVGIAFDNEEYGSRWTGASGYCGSYSLSACQAKVASRGKQVMTEVMKVFPNIVVLSFHGPSVSDPQSSRYFSGFPAWSNGNELKGPFFFGFMQGMGPEALNVDGGELYHLRSASDFAKAYQYQKYEIVNLCAFMPADLKPTYSSRVSISYGIYDRFGMTASTYGTTTLNGLRQADDYIWLYTESLDLIRGGSQDWTNALRQAKETYLVGAPTEPPGTPTLTPTPSPNPYDLDGNGYVNAADVLVLLENWINGSQGDFNSDGKVNSLDFGLLIANWGILKRNWLLT